MHGDDGCPGTKLRSSADRLKWSARSKEICSFAELTDKLGQQLKVAPYHLLSSFFPHPPPSHRRKGAPTTSRACFRQTTCHHHPHHHHKLEPGSTAPTPSSFPFLLSSSNTDDGRRRPRPLDSICCKGRDRKMYRDPGLHCGKPRRPDVSQGSSYFLLLFPDESPSYFICSYTRTESPLG